MNWPVIIIVAIVAIVMLRRLFDPDQRRHREVWPGADDAARRREATGRASTRARYAIAEAAQYKPWHMGTSLVSVEDFLPPPSGVQLLVVTASADRARHAIRRAGLNPRQREDHPVPVAGAGPVAGGPVAAGGRAGRRLPARALGRAEHAVRQPAERPVPATADLTRRVGGGHEHRTCPRDRGLGHPHPVAGRRAAVASAPMDEATKERIKALLAKRLGDLTVAEAIFLALTLDDADDGALAELVGLGR